MKAVLERKLSARNGINDPQEGSVPEQLDRVQRDLKDIVDGLKLLGIKRCSQCKKFFNSADPAALFDYGDLVCYACVPAWWSSLSGQLGIAERDKLEASLSTWLRKYHDAEVVKEDPGEEARSQYEFQIVVQCTECRGSGKILDGERCRFCKGRGTVWIVTPRQQ